MGAVVLATAAAFLVFAYSAAGFRNVSGYEISAEFSSVGGIRTGSDVRISGVSVGRVTGVTLNPETFDAAVAMMIDQSYLLPDDTSATVSSEGLLGGNFVELVPGGSPDMLEPGDRIAYTEDSVDLMRMLGRFIFSGDRDGAN